MDSSPCRAPGTVAISRSKRPRGRDPHSSLIPGMATGHLTTWSVFHHPRYPREQTWPPPHQTPVLTAHSLHTQAREALPTHCSLNSDSLPSPWLILHTSSSSLAKSCQFCERNVSPFTPFFPLSLCSCVGLSLLPTVRPTSASSQGCMSPPHELSLSNTLLKCSSNHSCLPTNLKGCPLHLHAPYIYMPHTGL